ncbi:hypothetical protein KA001_02420 [Patescibacteria group bacterium]|nr:hypothetical protein [Patescibacteria group bacterium]
MRKMENKILCISSEKLFENGKWSGLKKDNLEYYYKLLLESSEFRVRNELENDPNFKQIICQVILKYGDKYFLHKQINRSGEPRLNSLCPLPLGGHIEEFDISGSKDLIQTALDRELQEEVSIQNSIISKNFLGLIYLEDGNPVNLVHIGLLYLFELTGEEVHILEDGFEEIGFVDSTYLKEHIEELTYWSRIFVNECL